MEVFTEEFQHLKIPHKDILFATDNFSEDNVIGVGGFGRVYKGEISHTKRRSMVAFKRLDPRYGQGNPEFWKEIMTLSRYTHENLVSLLGFCDEGGEKILLYEYASHGSLDRHLSSTDLKWTQRLKICLGIAKGIRYLHDPKGTPQRVLHCDIKSANILVDKNWNAKVSDFGLSKMGPANQPHTIVVSHAVGTPGYCDPLYMEGLLTKESDVYSLGVVLFEVFCGRLCFEYSNGQCQILVPMWKQSYENNKLDEIVFQGLMQQMDPSSLEIFSDIAYLCLKKPRKERPMISHVVEKLETALQFQEIYEVVKQHGYGEIVKAAIPPLIYKSIEELKLLLFKGIFLNKGKTWFSVYNNGKHCEMISAAECLIPIAGESKNRYLSENGSRFVRGFYLAYDGKFNAHVKARFLTPQTTYSISLVFRFIYKRETLTKPIYSVLKYKLNGKGKPSISYLADLREDGLLMTELYQFTSDSRYIDLKIMFEASYCLAIEGIEFRPCENVRHEVLEDKKVDMHTISDSDTYWEQKLPNNYNKMIKCSKDGVQWTTKKELYFTLRKGFLISNGKEWLSLADNGKKCYMLRARIVLQEEQWSWECLPESRFEEVAVHPNKSFTIACTIKARISSPPTRYATYLVYKLPENPYKFETPMRVTTNKDSHSNNAEVRFICLVSDQIPVIRLKVSQNSHNSLPIRPKLKDIPKQRHDGWMEVQVGIFIADLTTKKISMHVELVNSRCKVIEGLIVQGIELKPI